jgi:hypothetical protein
MNHQPLVKRTAVENKRRIMNASRMNLGFHHRLLVKIPFVVEPQRGFFPIEILDGKTMRKGVPSFIVLTG